jgi:hypothetical protein
LVTDLGPGEREVLALALESPDSVCILDDALAAVRPFLDQLQRLRFRLASYTRVAVLQLAGESTD